MEKTKTTKFLGSFSFSKNGGGAGGTNNYDDLINQPAIDGVVLTKNTTKADLGITTGGSDKYGIRGDYASKYGIINIQNGLITYASASKEVTVKAGIQLLMPGSDTKTQIGSDIKYTINSTYDVTLFLADGEIKEAEGVYFQTEEPENGQEAYLAWFNPEVGKWQFKSNDDGNVWRTPTKAGPLADVHLSETGVIRVDYVGYRVLNDQIFALKSELNSKQDVLTAGNNITIVDNVISATGGSSTTISPVLNSQSTDATASSSKAVWDKVKVLEDNPVSGNDDFLITGTGILATDSIYSREFTKTKEGIAYGMVYANTSNYDGPILVSEDKDVVIYTPGGQLGGSFELDGKTWYYSAAEFFVEHGTSFTLGLIKVNTASERTFDTLEAAKYVIENGYSYIEKGLTTKVNNMEPTVQEAYTKTNLVAGNNITIDEVLPSGKVAINNALTKTSQLTNDSGFLTSVNSKTGNVVLTGADIQTTYTANPEVTEPTTSDINTALTAICEDIHNVLTNVPTGAELMSTTVYPYQAPLATDATLADVITKVNTILAIMSERGIMKKNI